MLSPAASHRPHNIVFGIVAASAVLIASGLGQLATFPNLGWYAGLSKPSFNPPNWVFGPTWTTLYALMAISAWRIMRLPASSDRSWALALFFTQLALNTAWSWMFFGLHSPLLGALNIFPQLALIVATAIMFHRLDRPAGWLLVPLAGWVTFASLLNITIWRLNA